MCSYAKYRAYEDKLFTLEHLKTNTHQVIAEMPSNMCQKVDENYFKTIEVYEYW